MTLVSLSGGAIATVDRFVIGSVISLSAVAWYSTAFDLTAKLWILPASLLPVLFPVFSAMQFNRKAELPPLFWRAITLLNAAVVPVVCLLLLCGEHLLRLWVGETFAEQGTPVIRWVASGSAISIVAQVPLVLLQSTGRASLPAVTQVILLPLYGLAIWCLAPRWGIEGVAAIWFSRGLLESLFLSIFSAQVLKGLTGTPLLPAELLRQFAVLTALPLFWLVGEQLSENPAGLVLAGFPLLLLLLIWEWNFLLRETDRMLLLERLRGAAIRLKCLTGISS